jgi:pentatricopeptide repeat protein
MLCIVSLITHRLSYGYRPPHTPHPYHCLQVTYSSVIKACAQAADVDGAERWFRAMCKVGFVPNAVPFNTVLNACARARNVAKAEEWLQQVSPPPPPSAHTRTHTHAHTHTHTHTFIF